MGIKILSEQHVLTYGGQLDDSRTRRLRTEERNH